MPNLVISDIYWSRVCPRAIALQFVISRDDGDYLSQYPWTQYPNRRVEINWLIGGVSPKGPFNEDSYNTYATRRYLVQRVIDNMPPGDYSITASADVVDTSTSPVMHFGAGGVGDGQSEFTVTNAIPILTQNAQTASVSPAGVQAVVSGTIGEFCPQYCTTVVNGSIYGVDDNMLPSSAEQSIGQRTSTGGYSQNWNLDATILNMPPVGGITTGVVVKFVGVTTNVWGQQSWPATNTLYFARPANKQWGDTGEGGGGHGGGGNG